MMTSVDSASIAEAVAKLQNQLSSVEQAIAAMKNADSNIQSSYGGTAAAAYSRKIAGVLLNLESVVQQISTEIKVIKEILQSDQSDMHDPTQHTV